MVKFVKSVGKMCSYLADPTSEHYEKALEYVADRLSKGAHTHIEILRLYEQIIPPATADSDAEAPPSESGDESPPYGSDDEETREIALELFPQLADGEVLPPYRPAANIELVGDAQILTYPDTEDEEVARDAERSMIDINRESTPPPTPTRAESFVVAVEAMGGADKEWVDNGEIYWNTTNMAHTGDQILLEHRTSTNWRKLFEDWGLPTWQYFTSVECRNIHPPETLIKVIHKKMFPTYATGKKVNKTRRRECWTYIVGNLFNNPEEYTTLGESVIEASSHFTEDFEENNRKKSLDHCHTTGCIRGVLCYSCNRLDVLDNIF